MQHDTVWQAVLGELEVTLSQGNFVTWFKNTRLLDQKDDTVVIGVTNPFVKQTLEKKIRRTDPIYLKQAWGKSKSD